MDPEGPLALRASSAFVVLPWFLRFSSNARMSRIKKISTEISTLTLSALADLKSLLARYDLKDLLRDKPVLELYDSHEDGSAQMSWSSEPSEFCRACKLNQSKGESVAAP